MHRIKNTVDQDQGLSDAVGSRIKAKLKDKESGSVLRTSIVGESSRTLEDPVD